MHVIRQEQIPQTQSTGFCLEPLNYTGRRPAVSLNFIVEALLIGVDVLIHERLQTPLQVLDFTAKREIHFRRLFSLLLRDSSRLTPYSGRSTAIALQSGGAARLRPRDRDSQRLARGKDIRAVPGPECKH